MSGSLRLEVSDPKLALIGGSGMDQMDGLTDRTEVDITTPFGPPSAAISIGYLDGIQVAFLPRHGRGHHISPTDIPARANIYALKALGVERVISISAVGSLKEEIKPLDLFIPDQLIDRTKTRINTFFVEGIVAHVGFAEPFCPVLIQTAGDIRGVSERTTHLGGSYIVMEGPQFSTRAESELYRSWGASVIGMTALPEAKLAREAEICYAILAMVTDYDCWHKTEEPVSVELVTANLMKTVESSRKMVRELVPRLPTNRECDCPKALQNAIITNPELMSGELRQRLSLIVDKYMKPPREVP